MIPQKLVALPPDVRKGSAFPSPVLLFSLGCALNLGTAQSIKTICRKARGDGMVWLIGMDAASRGPLNRESNAGCMAVHVVAN